ncbi:uncharacterized protein LOC107371026 [Tetranychus urticae]|uniref:uncharacterized protein LOC107371026 n=1 Tax=Tetranychus urticae TaxID=32264 RepID=UPI00077BC357|nr:uncharacterized protein LOC107371026 [Tetranychus urticae]
MKTSQSKIVKFKRPKLYRFKKPVAYKRKRSGNSKRKSYGKANCSKCDCFTHPYPVTIREIEIIKKWLPDPEFIQWARPFFAEIMTKIQFKYELPKNPCFYDSWHYLEGVCDMKSN